MVCQYLNDHTKIEDIPFWQDMTNVERVELCKRARFERGNGQMKMATHSPRRSQALVLFKGESRSMRGGRWEDNYQGDVTGLPDLWLRKPYHLPEETMQIELLEGGRYITFMKRDFCMVTGRPLASTPPPSPPPPVGIWDPARRVEMEEEEVLGDLFEREVEREEFRFVVSPIKQLAREGEISPFVYILVKGRVKLFKEGSRKVKTDSKFSQEFDRFEMALVEDIVVIGSESVINQSPMTHSVQVDCLCYILRLPPSYFLKYFSDLPASVRNSFQRRCNRRGSLLEKSHEKLNQRTQALSCEESNQSMEGDLIRSRRERSRKQVEALLPVPSNIRIRSLHSKFLPVVPPPKKRNGSEPPAKTTFSTLQTSQKLKSLSNSLVTRDKMPLRDQLEIDSVLKTGFKPFIKVHSSDSQNLLSQTTDLNETDQLCGAKGELENEAFRLNLEDSFQTKS